VLLKLETVLDESPETPVEDISADDVLRVQVQLHFTSFNHSFTGILQGARSTNNFTPVSLVGCFAPRRIQSEV